MRRQVISRTDVAMRAERAPATESTEEFDGYVDRLFKYIPAEVVAAYVAVNGAADGLSSGQEIVQWAIFAFMTVATWLYLARVQRVTKRKQLIISTVGFMVWAFFLGGPFEARVVDHETYGRILLPLYVFVIPIVEA